MSNRAPPVLRLHRTGQDARDFPADKPWEAISAWEHARTQLEAGEVTDLYLVHEDRDREEMVAYYKQLAMPE